MRFQRIALALASAAVFLGCPDWDSFTRGGGVADAGDSAAPAVGDASEPVEAAVDAAIVPSLTIDSVPELSGTVDLTARGPTDWLEVHLANSPGNRCQSCAQAIAPLTTNGAALDDYADGVRTFTWSNGAPVKSGTMTGGVLIADVGSAFLLSVTPNGQRQLLTMHVDTYFAGAKVKAKFACIDGPNPSIDLAPLQDGVLYSVRVHFQAPPTAKLQIDFTETATVPSPDPSDVANIAFSAVTLAPDP